MDVASGLGQMTYSEMLRDKGIRLAYQPAAQRDRRTGVGTYVPVGKPFWCSFVPKDADELEASLSNAPIANAELLIPPGTVFHTQDRFQLTHRNKQPITPITYDVLGEPEREPLLRRIELKLTVEKRAAS